MHKLNILYIGRHAEICETVVRLINSRAEWQATGAQTDEEALEAFNSKPFDMVLLGSGIGPVSEDALCQRFREQKPGIIIVQHYGGGSGLLYTEIMEALSKAPATFTT